MGEMFFFNTGSNLFPRESLALRYIDSNSLMRRSNCSAPIPPPGSPGVWKNMCVIKKGPALEKRVILVII